MFKYITKKLSLSPGRNQSILTGESERDDHERSNLLQEYNPSHIQESESTTAYLATGTEADGDGPLHPELLEQQWAALQSEMNSVPGCACEYCYYSKALSEQAEADNQERPERVRRRRTLLEGRWRPSSRSLTRKVTGMETENDIPSQTRVIEILYPRGPGGVDNPSQLAGIPSSGVSSRSSRRRRHGVRVPQLLDSPPYTEHVDSSDSHQSSSPSSSTHDGSFPESGTVSALPPPPYQPRRPKTRPTTLEFFLM